MSEFETKTGKNNYIQYYQENYNIKIKDTRQPLLQALPSNFEKKMKKARKIYLIPEICYMTGVTASMQRNFKARQTLIQQTQLPPNKRVERYENFLKEINSNKDVEAELAKWKIKYDTQLIKVPGVKLAGEKILLGKDKVSFNQSSADFTREIRSKKMFKSCTFRTWHIVFCKFDSNGVKTFVEHMETLTRQFGK